MNVSSFLKRFRKALKVDDHKDVSVIIREYLWLKLTNPSLAEQYFVKYLFCRDAGNLYDYLNHHKRHRQFWEINDNRFLPAMVMKNNFAFYLKQYGIEVVENHGHNNRALFFKDGALSLIDSPRKFLNFLLSLPVEGSLFIKKKEDSFGGKGIIKINPREVTSDWEYLSEVYQQVVASGYIFQEELLQHPGMNRLNPNCINTLRIVTYTNADKESRVLGAIQRTCLNDSYLDNVSNGGGYVGIDLGTGVLFNKIYTHLGKGTGRVYKQHPVSGVNLEGFKIPYFHQAKQLALKAAASLPQMILIGWDIAIQPGGPVIIEGNVSPGLNSLEIVQKGFRKNPVYLEMMKEVSE